MGDDVTKPAALYDTPFLKPTWLQFVYDEFGENKPIVCHVKYM
jgi:hypothetical protein